MSAKDTKYSTTSGSQSSRLTARCNGVLQRKEKNRRISKAKFEFKEVANLQFSLKEQHKLLLKINCIVVHLLFNQELHHLNALAHNCTVHNRHSSTMYRLKIGALLDEIHHVFNVPVSASHKDQLSLKKKENKLKAKKNKSNKK
eukprot:Lithocolla_globosa_v1_NODE_595_length_3638_cov_5.396037.p3 type:complete len:144 gc:universal NODE_595_length_3638_cov_5.396037:2153-1722(-)